jgi:hypothetical protein
MTLLVRPLGLTACAALSLSACAGDDAASSETTEGMVQTTGGEDPTTGGEDPTTGENPTTGQDPTTGGEDPTTGGEDPTTGGQTACYAPASNCFDNRFEPFECGGAPVCDALEVNDPSLNEFDPGDLTFVNPEAATCILEGLRDGTVGTYRINVEPGQQNSRWIEFEVLSDASVITHSAFQQDKCIDEFGSWAPLRDTAYFETCLLAADDGAMYGCLVTPGDEDNCIEADPVCPM